MKPKDSRSALVLEIASNLKSQSRSYQKSSIAEKANAILGIEVTGELEFSDSAGKK